MAFAPSDAGVTGLGFSITVPDSWFEVDTRPATRDASIKSLVYERVREQPDMREARPAIVKLLREFAERASAAGAVYCACMVHPTDEGPITASATITLIDSPGSAAAAPLTVDRLLDELSNRDAQGRITTQLTVAALPEVGEVARSYGVEDLQLPDGRTLRSVVMQTFVPLPGRDELALVSCSSPVLDLEDQLLDLFDAVTSTFRFVTA